ncbi:hypothetical protein [Arenimonas sp.]|uniref:hypothetical protein n=1 Tax=Arenimonas sp. TaxID=1872635 RepID=UPI0039E6ADF9
MAQAIADGGMWVCVENWAQAYQREKARARRCGDAHRKLFHVKARYRWRWL